VCDLENLKNEEAMTRVGSQRHSKKKMGTFFHNVDIYNIKEHTTVGIVVTRALRPSSIFCAALTLMPSAAQYREQSAVSC